MKYKRSFLRKCSGSGHSFREMCSWVTLRSLGETVTQVRSTAHLPKAGRRERSHPGVARAVWLPLPSDWDPHQPPPPQTLPLLNRSVATITQLFRKDGALGSPPCLYEKTAPSCSPGRPPWRNVCLNHYSAVFFVYCFDPLLRPGLEAGHLPDEVHTPNTSPVGALMLQATIQPL